MINLFSVLFLQQKDLECWQKPSWGNSSSPREYKTREGTIQWTSSSCNDSGGDDIYEELGNWRFLIFPYLSEEWKTTQTAMTVEWRRQDKK